MTLTFALAGACAEDRRDSRAEPSSSVDGSIATGGGETAHSPDTATPSRSDSSSSGASPERAESRRDTTAAHPPAASRPRPSPSRPRPSPSEGDLTRLQGTITVVGNAPVTQVLLVTTGGGSRTLAGPELPSLRRAAGTEVAVRGSSSAGGEFEVRDFTVVSVDGQPALDGVLEHEGSTLHLRTADRRVRLGNPPNDLHGLVGARVWLTGDPERGPNAFGLITPRR